VTFSAPEMALPEMAGDADQAILLLLPSARNLPL
jgi:hypothetical protein